MKISLIHPSRGRPQMAFEAAKQWIERAGMEVEYILSLDENDPTGLQYSNAYTGTGYRFYSNQNRSAVDAINFAAAASFGDILVIVSDDWDFPENWALQILEATKGKTDWIMKTPDGIQSWIITLPIMDRTYYNRFGYIYFQDYLHMFCDLELSAVADMTGRRITSPIPFKHNHYSVTKTTPDEVSRRADATWDQGEKLFLERYRKNFDLVNPIGRITDTNYLNWIKGKL